MAVVVNNVYFSHQRNVIQNHTLSGIYMNVPVGSIYGLLGPSACGKTTLLKCIIGLLKPNFGDISLFGYKPGDKRSGVPGGGVGYMPQELAVQYDLTIGEILTYFGKINFMESEHLENEIEFLVKILDLKNKQRMIGELSGGQKRRVSLAIAMLHKPRLLILDEPTVGVDPILCEVIWNLLNTLSSTLKTSIIITTHYIDETKRANRVAFMRKGCILEEGNPNSFIKKYEAKCLEDVFLKLCVGQKQQQKISDSSPEYQYTSNSRYKSVAMPYRSSNSSEFKKFFAVLNAIIWKFMIETRRDPIAVAMLLITTASIVWSVHFAIGKTPQELPVAWVVDEPMEFFNNSNHLINNANYSEFNDNSNIGLEKINLIIGNESIKINEEISEEMDLNYDENEYLYLPNILKKSINNKIIKLMDYSDFSIALKDAKKRIVHGIIYLKSNFSKSYLDSDPLFAELDEFVSNDTIDNGSVHVHIDFATLVIGSTIRYSIISAVQRFRKNIGEHFNMNANVFSSPITIKPINFDEHKEIRSEEDIFGVVTFIAPGFVVYNSFALCLGLCILSLIVPIECDMHVREYSLGVRPVQTILGQVTARFIFMFFNAILNLLVIIYVLGVPCRGSITLIMILMWLQMLLGLNVGVLMSSSMSSSYYSLITSMGVSFLFMVTNGVIWGIESQPYYLKWVMRYSPLFYSCNSLRALLFYSNPSFQLIWPGFFFTTLWTVLTFIAAVYAFSMKK